MPLLTGLQATAELHARRPGMRALILSVHVLKTAANCDLVAACPACMRGEPFPYPGAVSALIRDYLERARRGEATPEDPLTPRELRVVKLIAEGSTSDDIATRSRSARRPWIIARTFSRSLACATWLNSRATPSGAATDKLRRRGRGADHL